MIVRRLEEIVGTPREVSPENRNWVSRRLLLAEDGMGFAFTDTIIRAGTETPIHYKHHLEACYCIEGDGEVELLDGGERVPLRPGTCYALNRHDRHILRARRDLRLICVFNPPLHGVEVHRADGSYEPAQGGGYRTPLRFAYLNLKEHPRGTCMLQRLVEEGFVPDLIVEEDSTLAGKGRSTLLEELRRLTPRVPLPPTTDEALAGHRVDRLVVANHNDPECGQALKALGPDLVLLGDTRIIKAHIIAIPGIGVLNVHPGYLPEVRGDTPYVWALVKGLPQGCSVHFIDEGIDTGPLVLRQKIRLPRDASFPHLLHEINRLSAELIVEAAHLVRAGLREGIPQENFSLPGARTETFTLAPTEVREEAIRRLEHGG